jgi:hypothetical protein
MTTTYFPKHLQIETVNKLCNAKCPMCTIFTDARKAEIMKLDTYKQIIEKFIPYKDKIEFITLHGCGEPLLDKTISDKIAYSKQLGFRGLGFSTNVGLLKEANAKKLLDAGIDTLICSIDGFTKEVQEKIRVKAGDFDVIYANMRNFLRLRDEGGYKSRVLIRFIRQRLNYKQWDDYHAYWSQYIDRSKGDDILRFDVHNCGGKVPDYENMTLEGDPTVPPLNDTANQNTGSGVCPDPFERLIVFADGSIGFCSSDQDGYFKLPNILEGDPIAIFNAEPYQIYRKAWLEGRENELKYCNTCTIARSRNSKTKPAVTHAS